MQSSIKFLKISSIMKNTVYVGCCYIYHTQVWLGENTKFLKMGLIETTKVGKKGSLIPDVFTSKALDKL